MSINVDETQLDLDGLLDTFIIDRLEEATTTGLRTGIRACIMALIGAGHLATDAQLAYATVLGASEVDPLIVTQRGTSFVGDETMDRIAAALESEEGQVAYRQAIDDLTIALEEVEALLEQRRVAVAGDAGGADAGAVPAGDEA